MTTAHDDAYQEHVDAWDDFRTSHDSMLVGVTYEFAGQHVAVSGVLRNTSDPAIFLVGPRLFDHVAAVPVQWACLDETEPRFVVVDDKERVRCSSPHLAVAQAAWRHGWPAIRRTAPGTTPMLRLVTDEATS